MGWGGGGGRGGRGLDHRQPANLQGIVEVENGASQLRCDDNVGQTGGRAGEGGGGRRRGRCCPPWLHPHPKITKACLRQSHGADMTRVGTPFAPTRRSWLARSRRPQGGASLPSLPPSLASPLLLLSSARHRPSRPQT